VLNLTERRLFAREFFFAQFTVGVVKKLPDCTVGVGDFLEPILGSRWLNTG
jgi:hypothetical protein